MTGSRHMLHVGEASVMLDCGLFQGHRRESRERNRHLPFAADLDAVVLSHAHLDHSGALLALVRGGWRGRVHATAATRDLCAAMLADAARIEHDDVRHVNRHREPDAPEVEALYGPEDVDPTMERFVAHPYGKAFPVGEGVRVTLRDAGHIVGSAGVLVEVEDGPSVYFTGDLGRRAYPILRDPEPLPRADAILAECTYGDREHEPVAEAEATVREVLDRAVRTGGKVFVPAFSVGRAQNLIHAWAMRRDEGALPDLPVFVDSPLARQAAAVLAAHPELHDEETRAFLDRGGDPFHPEGVTYVEDAAASKALNHQPGPFVVIAGSGMCEGGRIVHHLLHGIEDPRNSILFVGHAAADTLARRILDGAPTVRVLGRTREVQAHVARIAALSAHADREALLAFLAPARAWESTIFLVHGEERVALAFAQTLRAEGHREVVVPETYARYEVAARRGRRLRTSAVGSGPDGGPASSL